MKKQGAETNCTNASMGCDSKFPRLSSEVFTIPLDGAHIVYAPLRQAAFIANAELVNLIADIKEGLIMADSSPGSELVEFLQRLQIVDGGEETRPITSFSGPVKPTSITLFLTTGCNLRCTYCYAAAGDTPLRAMTIETACRGVDFILGNVLELKRNELEIAYHGGGEPSANWATLTGSYLYAVQQASKHGLCVRASLATNGVLSDEKIDWIVQNLKGASVSFDGLPEINDSHRVTVSGKPSSGFVIHTLRRFELEGFPYGIRLTVTRENICRLPESIGFICEMFRPRRIQVEPAYQLGRWREAASAETTGFIEAYRKAQDVAQKLNQEITFSGARLGLLSNHFCGVTQDSFCLTADGAVSACYETFIQENELSNIFFYGRYEKGSGSFEFNLPILEKLRMQSVEHREFCQGCFAKWSCGGDCYHKAVSVSGTTEFAGSDRCHIIRELTKDQILQKIHKSGGLFWHDVGTRPLESKGKELLL